MAYLIRKVPLILFIALLFCKPTSAGNPLYVNPDSSPLIWNTTAPIQYKVDAQGFGALTHEQSIALVNKALQVWLDITNTAIQFEYAGSMQEALTINNWESIVGEVQQEQVLFFGFDNTSEIVAAEGSEGAVGIHSLTGVSGTSAEPGFITSAIILLNGTYYNGDSNDLMELDLDDVFAILIHEIGHALGLEHSLANAALYEDILNGERPLDDARYLPTMFPRFIRGTGEMISTLNPDDMITLQQLYGTQNNLSGEISNADGSPAEAIVVTARSTESALCRVYSQVTGLWCGDRNSSSDGSGAALFNSVYCVDETKQGTFDLAVDPLDTYVVSAEDIPELFEDSITRLLGQVDHTLSEAEFFNTSDAASEEQFSFDTIEVDAADVPDLNVLLAEAASTDPAVTTFPISYFEESDTFSQGEDDLCPRTAEIDISSELSTIAPLPEEVISSGCSLTRSAATPCHSFVLWALLAFGFLATRLRLALYGQNPPPLTPLRQSATRLRRRSGDYGVAKARRRELWRAGTVLSLHNSLTPDPFPKKALYFPRSFSL